MGWEKRNVPAPPLRRECPHFSLIGASISVALGKVGIGSTFKCDSCSQRWVVTSSGPDGIKKLEEIKEG